MKPVTALVLAAAFAASGTLVRAQDAKATDRGTARPEPNVQRSVIEDEGSRIEELRVRGQSQRIVVTPKVGPRTSYEIVTGDGSHDLSEGVAGTRGAIGKRVWHVLSF